MPRALDGVALRSRATTVTSVVAAFHCSRGTSGRTFRLRLCGDIDSGATAELAEALRQTHDHAGGALVILDLSGLGMLAPGAARALVAADHRYRLTGGRTVAVRVPAPVRRHLRMMGLGDALEVVSVGATTTAPVAELPIWLTAGPPAVATTRIVGPVSPEALATLRRRIQHAADQGHRQVVVDLEAVTPMGHHETLDLAAALTGAATRGPEVVVVGATPALRRRLEAAGGMTAG